MSRTYRDPIHQEINLNSEDPVEDLIINLIDCRELQRLRWIRQLGTSWYTFHGAEASRFQHSLGAMHVSRLMLEKLFKDLKLDTETAQDYKATVLSAALLHDIGHGPFSHSCEKIIKFKHEEWTKKLLESPDTQINKVLNKYDPQLSSKVISLLSKTHPAKFLCNIVSSQLDCDRFDYLLRDSYYTGTSYGNFDLQRVISSLTVNLEHDCLVVAGDKGMLAVEDYLYARYSMYLQVYQHKKSLATEILLQKLFKRLKLLCHGRKVAFLESALYNWITTPERLSVKDFLMIDDTYIIHHIKHWLEEKDIVLKDLSKRFIERSLFKAIKIQPGDDTEKLLAERSIQLKKLNLDPDYYLDTVTIAANPYSFYNPDSSNFFKAIFVQNHGQLQEISEISHVVASLVKNDFQNSWMVSV